MVFVLSFLFAGNMMARNKWQEKGYYVPEVGKSVKPEMRVLAREHRNGYECRLVDFSVDDSYYESDKKRVEDTERIRAYLLVPDKATRVNKCPAVLMLHDHGARFDIGKEKLVRPIYSVLPDGKDDHIALSSLQWLDKYFDGVYFADSLASLGYVVLVADALYWGERSTEDTHLLSRMNYDPGYVFPEEGSSDSRKKIIKGQKEKVYDGQRLLYDSLYAKGVIWAEKMLRDDVASVHLLKSLPYVDRKNIGSFGFSMGAHRCWMLAAFCDDVKCGVALSWMTSMDGDPEGDGKASDYSMMIMPMRSKMDFGDIGMFLAPKPMLFLNGDKDHLFPKEKVEIAFCKLQGHYESYNRRHSAGHSVEPRFSPLQTSFFNGGHYCGKNVQAYTVQFFDENLK